MPPIVDSDSSMLDTSTVVQCVSAKPIIKKMKGLKKIKRKMGLSPRITDAAVLPESPIFFHACCGDNVRICHDGLVARRTQSFCKGIAFSHRPVKINEKVCIRLLEVSNNWSGVVRFGFTSVNPSNLDNSLPRYVCPDLTNRAGFWAKALPEKFGQMGNIVHFSVSSAGDLLYGVNNKDEGVFLSGLETKAPMWVMLDIYGNSTAVQFVNPNNMSPTTVANRNNNQQTSCSAAISAEEKLALDQARQMTAAREHMKIKETNDFSVIRAVHHESSPDKLALKYNHEYVYSSLSFHLTKGVNITYRDSKRSVAIRKFNTIDHGYVFTERPMRVGEVIVIQILDQDSEYNGALSFGVTSAHPNALNSTEFPSESELLLDRPEYWAMQTNIGANASVGDEIRFSFLPDGRIKMTINDHASKTLMFVDTSLRLYAFFDIYGATTKIRMVGTAKVPRCISELNDNEIRPEGTLKRLRDTLVVAPTTFVAMDTSSPISREISRRELLSPPQQTVHLPPEPRSKMQSTHQQVMMVPREPMKPPTDSRTECTICFENSINAVLYSCGHMCMCYDCAMKLFVGKGEGLCPICRAPIKDVIRTYKS